MLILLPNYHQRSINKHNTSTHHPPQKAETTDRRSKLEKNIYIEVRRGCLFESPHLAGVEDELH